MYIHIYSGRPRWCDGDKCGHKLQPQLQHTRQNEGTAQASLRLTHWDACKGGQPRCSHQGQHFQDVRLYLFYTRNVLWRADLFRIVRISVSHHWDTRKAVLPRCSHPGKHSEDVRLYLLYTANILWRADFSCKYASLCLTHWDARKGGQPSCNHTGALFQNVSSIFILYSEFSSEVTFQNLNQSRCHHTGSHSQNLVCC